MSSPYQPGFQSTQQGDRSKSEFSFAPGETNILVTHYSPSLMTAWLKTELPVTSRRLLARKSNTLLGFRWGMTMPPCPSAPSARLA